MNNFTKAHKMTKEIIQAGDNYAATFALCLKHIHQTEANKMVEMTDMQKLMAVYIADAEARIVALKVMQAANPTGYVVVSLASNHPLKFENGGVSISNIENASRYSERRIADAKGRTVRNGAGGKSVGRSVMAQIESEIADQLEHIEVLKRAK